MDTELRKQQNVDRTAVTGGWEDLGIDLQLHIYATKQHFIDVNPETADKKKW